MANGQSSFPDVNILVLVGRVGTDPECREAGSSTVCKFRLASNGRNDRTNWVTVEAWGKLADTCQTYLRKGARIHLSGRLEIEEWEDRDGNKRVTVKLVADQMHMLDRKSDRDVEEDAIATVPAKPSAKSVAQSKRPAPVVEDDEDLPF